MFEAQIPSSFSSFQDFRRPLKHTCEIACLSHKPSFSKSGSLASGISLSDLV